MRLACDLDVVRRVIVVGVGVVQESPCSTSRRVLTEAEDFVCQPTGGCRARGGSSRHIARSARAPSPRPSRRAAPSASRGIGSHSRASRRPHRPTASPRRAGAGIERQRHAVVVGELADAPVAARAYSKWLSRHRSGAPRPSGSPRGWFRCASSPTRGAAPRPRKSLFHRYLMRAPPGQRTSMAIGVTLQIPRHERDLASSPSDAFGRPIALIAYQLKPNRGFLRSLPLARPSLSLTYPILRHLSRPLFAALRRAAGRSSVADVAYEEV